VINGLDIVDLPVAEYRDVLKVQHELTAKRIAGEISDVAIIVEHCPVITTGVRDDKNKLLVSAEKLVSQGVDLVDIARGGGATAHNPGQIVFYVIMNLKDKGLGITEFIRTLEDIGIELLGKFGVSADRKKGFPGLWTDDKKIASIGVKVKKWTTFHGMAININNDLSIFDNIIPCGLDGVVMTSLSECTSKKIDMQKVREELKSILKRRFGK